MTITITVGEVGDYMKSQQIDDSKRAFREVAYNKVWPTSTHLPQVIRNWVENENFINEHYSRVLDLAQTTGSTESNIEIEVPEDVA
jgi:hypothetical protein